MCYHRFKKNNKAKTEPRIPQNDFTEVNDFVEIEVVIPNLKYIEKCVEKLLLKD